MMVATAAVRRGGVVALALAFAVALVVSLAGQAMAADVHTSQFKGGAAFADWKLDDARNTDVDVGALEGRYLDSPLQHREDVFLSVDQEYCDDSENELVHRSFFAFGLEDQGSASVDEVLLTSASATLKGTVHGFEFRVPGCDDPNHDDGEFNHLGEFDVRLDASWKGTGKLDTSVSAFHFNDEDFVFNSANVRRSRDAEANATLRGLDEFDVAEDLGTTTDAEIMSVVSSRVSVRR